jgi:osmotically-inducible protein OsmY
MTRKTIVSIALAAAVLVGATAAFAAETQADWSTTLNVKLVLLNKLGADSLRVDVDAVGGAVTLTGIVAKRETKELAETVAKSVEGVKKVNNEIRLDSDVANPSTASVAAGETEAELEDALLQTKVRLALVDKMGSDGFKIGTDAADGVVTLEFEKSFTAGRRQEAAQIVKSVDGVKKVVPVDKK